MRQEKHHGHLDQLGHLKGKHSQIEPAGRASPLHADVRNKKQQQQDHGDDHAGVRQLLELFVWNFGHNDHDHQAGKYKE